MFSTELKEAGYKIIQSQEQNIIFENNGKQFAVCKSHTGLTVYRVIKQDNDFQLLPGFKTGKSFKTVANFVNQRS